MQIIKIDLEGIYSMQSWHQHHGIHINNLELDTTNGVNGYCSIEAQKMIKRACTTIRMPALSFLGSGNYHYLTYFLLQQINRPFSLVLFDFHSDMQAGISDSLLSCGNWVSFAMRDNPHMKQVFICGLSERYIPSVTLMSSKQVHYFTEKKLHSYGWLSDFERLSRYPIYVSIDKDVFDLKFARTNWDQGSMNQDMMISFFELIFQKKELIGGDICGECSVDYSDPSYLTDQKCNSDMNSCLTSCFMEQL